MSAAVYVFGGRSSRSDSPLHAAQDRRRPQGGLRYRAYCGSWISTTGQGFAPGVKGSCPACSRIFCKQHTEPDE